MWLFNKIKENKMPFLMLGAGLILFAVLFLFGRGSNQGNGSYPLETAAKATAAASGSRRDYAEEMESKLEDVLADTAGVGKVKVAVSLEDEGEIYPFTEGSSSTDDSKESDSAGGLRENRSQKGETGASIIQNGDGSESVVITKSKTPTVKGVIVCVRGADSYVVQERIIKAIKAFCQISVDRIEILPMEE